MRNILESIKIIALELIGIIIGLLWSYKSNWDYEPILLLITSTIGFIISIALLLLPKETNIRLSNELISKTNTNNADNSILPIPNELLITYTNIEPVTIKNKLQNTPPFQQTEVAKNFKNINVKWLLKLSIIGARENNLVYAMMKHMGNDHINICFYTSTDKYPILKIAERDTEFVISGKIIDCKLFDIELELISLE